MRRSFAHHCWIFCADSFARRDPALEDQKEFLGISAYVRRIHPCPKVLVCVRKQSGAIFRNICVRTQNTHMSQGTCLCAQTIQRWKVKIIMRISAYVHRIHPCAEMIQITSSLTRIYNVCTPILLLMDFCAVKIR